MTQANSHRLCAWFEEALSEGSNVAIMSPSAERLVLPQPVPSCVLSKAVAVRIIYTVNMSIIKGILQTTPPWRLDGEIHDPQSPPDNVSCLPGTSAGECFHHLTAAIAFGPCLLGTHSSQPGPRHTGLICECELFEGGVSQRQLHLPVVPGLEAWTR